MGIRIVGGRFARRRLEVPSGERVRPTSDRVRESLFSSLGDIWDERPVLDLFAGSGCLGLECLSRGAPSVTFVERDARVLRVLRNNLRALGVDDRARVWSSDALKALGRFEREGRRFGAVLLDPPYATTLLSKALETLSRGRLLTDDAIVVAEHPSKAEVPEAQGGLRMRDQRRYGDTTVTIYDWTEGDGERA